MDKIPNLHRNFLWGMSTFIILSAHLSYFYIKENPQKQEFENLSEIIKIFPKFFTNPNLRRFILFNILAKVGFSFWANTSTMVLLDNGFNKDNISILNTINMVVSLLSILFISKLDFGKPFKIYKFSIKILYFICLAEFIVVLYFEKYQNHWITYQLLMVLSIFSVISYLKFTASSVFTNQICDP